MRILLCVSLFMVLFSASVHSAATPKKVSPDARQIIGALGPPRNYCPLCDSSVYSYCDHKIFHDSCCCRGQYGGQGSFHCLQEDCTYLHANSCHEHALIAECCCDD